MDGGMGYNVMDHPALQAEEIALEEIQTESVPSSPPPAPKSMLEIGLEVAAEEEQETREKERAANRSRGEILLQDLNAGKLDCIICSETVHADKKIWACVACYHIYHFDCISNWARSRSSSWPCPTCKETYTIRAKQMIPTCWCRKNLFDTHTAYNSNSCGTICGKKNECPLDNRTYKFCYTNCVNPCHPGPCEKVPCESACAEREAKRKALEEERIRQEIELVELKVRAVERAARAVALKAEANARERSSSNPPYQSYQSSRHRNRSPDDISVGEVVSRSGETRGYAMGMGCSGIIWFISFMALLLWSVGRVGDWTWPLDHMHYTEHTRSSSDRGEITAAWFMGLPVLGLSSILFVMFLSFLARESRDECARVCGPLFPAGLMMAAFVGIVWLTTGQIPKTWDDRFRNTCRDFDTRIVLDTDNGLPSTNLLFEHQPTSHNLYPQARYPDTEDFTLTITHNPSVSTDRPYSTYHRMASSLRPSQPLAIDFDLSHGVWRILNLTSTPSTPSTNYTTIKSGTWINSTSTSTCHGHDCGRLCNQRAPTFTPHILIPELSLLLPDFIHYTTHCAYQPFMLVHALQTYDEASIVQNVTSSPEINKLAFEEWTTKSAPSIVMRTATMKVGGKGKRKMVVCARRGDYWVSGKGHWTWDKHEKTWHEREAGRDGEVMGVDRNEKGEYRRKGLGDDVVVPLGLMAVLRRQMVEDGRMEKACGYTKNTDT